jgi:hypothetical protein
MVRSAIMVNGSLPRTVAICLRCTEACESARKQREFGDGKTPPIGGSRAFAQILGKLYFLQFFENLRRILVDYGQKHRRRANAAFNAAC